MFYKLYKIHVVQNMVNGTFIDASVICRWLIAKYAVRLLQVFHLFLFLSFVFF